MRLYLQGANNANTITILITAFVSAGILQSIISLLQLYGVLPSFNAYFKMTGTFGNPDALAGYLASVSPFAFGLYLSLGDQKIKWLTGFFLVLIILVLPATMIRNGWIASSAGIFFVLAHAKRGKILALFSHKLLSSMAMTVLMLSIILSSYGLYFLRPESIQGRLLIWKMTVQMTLDHPICGLGLGRYGMEYGYYQATYFAQHPGNNHEKYLAGNVNHAHNEYLEILTELGMIGLLLFLAVIYILWNSKNSQKPDPISTSAKASLLSILIFMFASFPLHILPTAVNTAFITAVMATTHPPAFVIRLHKPVLFTTAGILLITALFVLKYTAKTYIAYREWHSAVQLSMIRQLGPAVALYEKLYDHFNHDGQFLLNYGGTLGLMGEHVKAIDLLNKAQTVSADPNIHISLGNSYAALGDISQAEYHYWQAFHLIPNRLYPLYLLAKLYSQHNMPYKAQQIGAAVIQFKEKIPSPVIFEMKKEIKALLNTTLADEPADKQ